MTVAWLISGVSALIGAIGGGAGVMKVAKSALVEELRKVFPEHDDVISPLEHEKTLQEYGREMRAEFREFLVQVRNEFESKFTPTAARLEREHNGLRADLERAIGELRLATQMLRSEGESGKEAYAEARLAVEKVEGLQRLFEALTQRVGRMEEDVKLIGEIRTTISELKGQLEDVLNYQIAEERRRTKEGGR